MRPSKAAKSRKKEGGKSDQAKEGEEPQERGERAKSKGRRAIRQITGPAPANPREQGGSA